jgi:hypothetical protein
MGHNLSSLCWRALFLTMMGCQMFVPMTRAQTVDGYDSAATDAAAQPIPVPTQTQTAQLDGLPDDLGTQLAPMPDQLPIPARASSPFSFVIDGGWATVATSDSLVHGGYIEAGVTVAFGGELPGLVGGFGLELGLLAFGLVAPGSHGAPRQVHETLYSDVEVSCRPIESAAAGGALFRAAFVFLTATIDVGLGPAFVAGPRRDCLYDAETFQRSQGNPYWMLTFGMEVGFDRARTVSLRGGGYFLLATGDARESTGGYAGIGVRL